MCGHRSAWQQRQVHNAPPYPRRSADDLVGDRERQRRADLVGRAFADGLLDFGETEAMLDAVLRARTLAELDAATAILPSGWVAASQRADAAAQRAVAQRSAHRRSVQAYLGVMALLMAIWAVTAITAGATYFWPVWPGLGWGIPLLLGKSAGAGNDAVPVSDDELIAGAS